MSTTLNPAELKAANDVMKWAEEYLSQPHEKMTREKGNNIVCPFVSPSIKNNTFYIAVKSEINEPYVDSVVDIIQDFFETFKRLRPYQAKQKILKGLCICFPNLKKSAFPVLDMAFEIVKPKAIQNKLMIAQFHPDCKEVAFHNRSWNTVSVSPVPLIAIRHMAIHDIMFLNAEREWFDEYNRAFGDKFRAPEKLADEERFLEEVYREALVRHRER